MAESRIEALLNIPLFSRLSARQIRKILEGAIEDTYQEDAVIVRERSLGKTLFVIIEGTVRVVYKDRTVARRSKGDYFGEISVIDGRPRTATVIAETPVRCLVLYQQELKRIVTREPEAAWEMLVSMAQRIRDL